MSSWIWNLGRNYIDFFSKFWPEVRKGLKDRDRKFYYGELRFKEDKSFSFVVDEYLTDLEVYNRLLSNTNVMSMRFVISSLVDEGYNLFLPKIKRKSSVRQYRVAWIARVVYYYQLKKIFKKLNIIYFVSI